MHNDLDDFIGMKIYLGENPEEYSLKGVEFEWEGDDETLAGTGTIIFDSRPYDDENDWTLQNSLTFETNEDGVIESIEIGSEVHAWGDSGLGETDPDNEWTWEDYDIACKYMKILTTPQQTED